MDSEKRRIAQHLLESERHVAEGERLVEHQRMRVEKRRRDGHHTQLAMQLLTEMEESLRLHLQDRDRLRQELAGNVQPRVLRNGIAAAVSERT
jgi:hypothetical protein